MSITAKLTGLLELVRPHNLFVAAVTAYIGYGIGVKMLYNTLTLDWGFALCATAVVLVAAGGYAINDYYDVAIDAVNKPWRPIPSGRVSRGEALLVSLLMFVSGLAAAATLGPVCLTYASIVALVLYLYSWKLKREGFVGNCAVAFSSASTILFGALAFSELTGYWKGVYYSLIPFCYAFALVLAREVVKGIEDVLGDRAEGVKTLAAKYGIRTATTAAVAMLAFIVALSPLPMVFGVYGPLYGVFVVVVDALVVASIVILLRGHDAIKAAARARTLLKWAFLCGAIAFITGLL